LDFGDNKSGQLGLGDNQDKNIPTQIPDFKAKQISAGSSHTVVIDLDYNIWTFGYNGSGQLGLGDTQNRNIPTQITFNDLSSNEVSGITRTRHLKAKQVSSGIYYTAIIDLNDNIWVFGDNRVGQLGLGDRQDRNIPIQIPHFKAYQVSAGEYHTVTIATFII
jgi:alpha-tubulin suppressor-like RCC1 family protein